MPTIPPLAAVVGASGFLGRHVVRRLAAAGWRVRAASREPERAGHLRPLGDLGQVIPVAADVRRPETLTPAFADADAVVNLVGILFARGRQTFPAVHAEGAGNVARAARAAGATNLVHVSALGADPSSPSVYARTKAEGEARVRDAFPRATVLRPGVVFGPEDDFFNRFAAAMRIAPALPLPDGGRTRMQPVHADDVAGAVLAALARGNARGTTFELGGPEVRTFREILAWIRTTLGRRCMLVSVPSRVLWLPALLLEALPRPPLTRDQLRLLAADSVTSGNAPGLADLGVRPTPFESSVPPYLERFRRRGIPRR